MKKLFPLLLLATTVLADVPLKNEGVSVGNVITLDCVGSAINCTRTLSTGTITVTASAETTADLVLYVDPLGSDSNACTSTGASACLTIQGALNKSPRFLKHRVTVNVAAGNYAGFLVSGFAVDASTQKATAGILIDGVLANVTPATGTATGTATGGTAGSTTTFGTLTDSGQGWTTNNLRGRLVSITGGTGSGQVKVITANTSTSLTIAGTWTAPVAASSTYAIQAPAAIVTSTTALVPTPIGATAIEAAGIQIANNVMSGGGAGTASGAITIRNLAVSVGASTGLISTGTHGVNLLQTSITSAGLKLQNGSRMTMTTGTVVSSGVAVNMTLGAQLLALQSYINSSSVGMLASTGSSLASTSNQVLVAGAQSDCVAVGFGGTGTATSTRCDCQSAALSGGVVAGNAMVPTAPQLFSTIAVANGLDVTNCTFAAAAENGTVTFGQTATLSGNSLTATAYANNNGVIFLPSAITITTAGNDISVDDGAITSTYAALLGIYSCVASLATGSRVCRL